MHPNVHSLMLRWGNSSGVLLESPSAISPLLVYRMASAHRPRLPSDSFSAPHSIGASVLQGDIYNVAMAGRYGTEDDDEYADADISLFDDDEGDDSASPDPAARTAAAVASLAPRSHTIDAARGFLDRNVAAPLAPHQTIDAARGVLGGNVADEDDLEQQAHNDAALAAAAEVGGLGNDTVSGAPGIVPGEQLANQMAELRLMEATTVDEDDEVVTGDEAEGSHGIQDRPLRGGAAGEATEVVEEVEEEEEEEGREESGVTANWWKIPAPEVPEADVPPPEAEAVSRGGAPDADAAAVPAGIPEVVRAEAGRDSMSGAAAMVVEEDATAAALDRGPDDAVAVSSVAVVDEELVPGASSSQAVSGQTAGAS